MAVSALWPRRGLYLLTPDTANTERLLEQVAAVLPARPALLQYRSKAASADIRYEQAHALAALCARHGVGLIVNDEVALAQRVGALGVHLGRDDPALGAARAALGTQAILGASCYDDLALAERAVAQGADYIAFGAFFVSPSKPQARRAAIDLLRASAYLRVPRVAIGGISADNAEPLVRAGADLIAVISGVFDAADPLAAARRLQAFYD